MNEVKLIVLDDMTAVKISADTDPIVTIKVDGSSGALPPVYDGETTVIPSAVTEQILQTKEKIVKEDITINKIPYAEVSNDAGGYTVSIAS